MNTLFEYDVFLLLFLIVHVRLCGCSFAYRSTNFRNGRIGTLSDGIPVLYCQCQGLDRIRSGDRFHRTILMVCTSSTSSGSTGMTVVIVVSVISTIGM